MRAALNGGSTLPGAVTSLGKEGKNIYSSPAPHTRVSYSGSSAHPLNGVSFRRKCEGWFFFCVLLKWWGIIEPQWTRYIVYKSLAGGMVTPGSPWGQAWSGSSAPFLQGPPQASAQSGFGLMFGGWVDGQHACLWEDMRGPHQRWFSDGWISLWMRAWPSVCPPAPGLIELIKINK